MSQIKATATIVSWFLAFVILYAFETADWPEARHWHILDWHVWALGFLNAAIVNSVIAMWKALRRDDV